MTYKKQARLEMLKAMYNASTGRPLREAVALITEIRKLEKGQ